MMMHKRIRPKDIAYLVYRCGMSLDDVSDLLMSTSSMLTCCLEMMSSEPSDACCALADHGNFGSLLRGVERKHAEVVGSKWKTVEASGRQVEGAEDVWKGVEDQEGVRRGQEGLGEVQKCQEEVGKVVEECGRDRKAQEGTGM